MRFYINVEKRLFCIRDPGEGQRARVRGVGSMPDSLLKRCRYGAVEENLGTDCFSLETEFDTAARHSTEEPALTSKYSLGLETVHVAVIETADYAVDDHDGTRRVTGGRLAEVLTHWPV